jgi:hypothetical protein
MSATLTVRREPGAVMELRRGPFDVALDGSTAGSIARHETFEAPLAPGHHSLQVRTGRYTSHTESFDVADGDAVNFLCNGSKIWPVYLVSLAVPSLALTLKRE